MISTKVTLVTGMTAIAMPMSSSIGSVVKGETSCRT